MRCGSPSRLAVALWRLWQPVFFAIVILEVFLGIESAVAVFSEDHHLRPTARACWQALSC